MSKIKSELNHSNVASLDFCIAFRIEKATIITTSTFRLVSSCSQLPSHIKSLVRPPKKRKTMEKNSKEVTTDSSSGSSEEREFIDISDL